MSLTVVQENSDATVRLALKQRYLRLCDAALVEPATEVIRWLESGVLDELRISPSSSSYNSYSLSIAKKVHPVTGTLLESDPVEPLIGIMKLIPLTGICFDETHLQAQQVEKILRMLLEADSRSLWTLSSLILYGSVVDATVFPTLLEVVSRCPLLTTVLVDPSPQCHMYQLEQLCAANEARCRQSFVQRKREEINRKISSPIGDKRLEGSQFRSSHSSSTTVAAAASRGDDSVGSSLTSHLAIVAASPLVVANSIPFSVGISTFLGALKSWTYFFYGPKKPLPSSMFYFMVSHILSSIPRVSNADSLMEELKQMEKRFVLWREGQYVLPEHTSLLVDSSRVRPRPSLHHCSYCDGSVSQPYESPSSLDKYSRMLIDTLLMEAEVGSKSFVQDTSTFLASVFSSILERFSPMDLELKSTTQKTEVGAENMNFLLPPQFCEKGQKCIKRFCRSIFCEARGFPYGAKLLEEDSTRGTAEISIFNAEALFLVANAKEISPNPLTLYKNKQSILSQEMQAQQQQQPTALLPSSNNNHDQPHALPSFAGTEDAFEATRRNPMSTSVVDAFKSVVEAKIKNFSVDDERLLETDHLTSNFRFPREGMKIADLFRHLHRTGIPILGAGGRTSTNDPMASTILRPTLCIQFSWPGNSPDRPLGFSLIRDYFLRHQQVCNGSDVVMGVKLRPQIFTALCDENASSGPILLSEKVDSCCRYGVPVTLRICGVAYIGDVWYLKAFYMDRLLYLDENVTNIASSRFGAFAFIDCALDRWLEAMRYYSPQTLHTLRVPIELIENTEEAEEALQLLLHCELFYESPQAFAYRKCLSVTPPLIAAIADLQRIISDASLSQTTLSNEKVNRVALLQLVEWYREGCIGQVAKYWQGHPGTFRDVVVTATRRIFAHARFPLHPSLDHASRHASHVRTTLDDDVKQPFPLRPNEPQSVWYIPSASSGGDTFAMSTSGRLVESSPTISDQPSRTYLHSEYAVYNAIPSHLRAVDMSYHQSSSTMTPHGRRRFIAFNIKDAVYSRFTKVDIQFSLEENTSAAPTLVKQLSVGFEAMWSDDGKTFYTCGTKVVFLQEKSSSNTRMTLSLSFGNVGAHPWWVIYTNALDGSKQPIYDDDESFIFPAVDFIGWWYLPYSIPLLICECSPDFVVAAPTSGTEATTAVVFPRPRVDFEAKKANSGSPQHWLVNLYSDGMYLRGVETLLGGAPDFTIALSQTLAIAFRQGFVVEFDGKSGQARSQVQRIDYHPITSQFPLLFRRQMVGGCLLSRNQQNNSKMLLMHTITHFSFFDLTTLSCISEPAPWSKLPGRPLIELDAKGVAVHTELIQKDGDPYSKFGFPFPEVEWCICLTSSHVNGSPQLLIGFIDECVRWQLDLSGGSPSNNTCEKERRSLPLSDVLPALRRKVHLDEIFEAALMRSKRNSNNAEVHLHTPSKVKILWRGQTAPQQMQSKDVARIFVQSSASPHQRSSQSVSRPWRSNRSVSDKTLHRMEFSFHEPVQVAIVQLFAECTAAEVVLQRATSADAWETVSSGVRQEESGLIHADCAGTTSRKSSRHWAIEVLDPTVLSALGKVAVYTTARSQEDTSVVVIDPCIFMDLGDVEVSSKPLSDDSAVAVPMTVPILDSEGVSRVINGLELSWIDVQPLVAMTSATSLRITIGSPSGEATPIDVTWERIRCMQAETTQCMIPIASQLANFVSFALVGSVGSAVHFRSRVRVALLPLQRVPISLKPARDDEESTVPLHLRVSPEAFAKQSLSRHSDVESIPSPGSVFLKRRGYEFVFSLSSISDNRRLVRLTVEAQLSQVHGSVAGTISYQDLACNWIPCSRSVLSSTNSTRQFVDFVWHNVQIDPPPQLWKISFGHVKVNLRSVIAHLLDAPAVVSTVGYRLASSFNGVESLSRFHNTKFSAAADHLAQQVLRFVGDTTGVPFIRIDVPLRVGSVSGLQFFFAESVAPATSTRGIQIDVVDSSDVRRTVYSGPLSSNVSWAPLRCKEITLTNCTRDVSGLILCGGDSSCLKHCRDYQYTLVVGENSIALATMPAQIPLQVGAQIEITSADNSAVPPELLFAAVNLQCSVERVAFQIAYWSESANNYKSVALVESAANNACVTEAWGSYVEFPKKWRMTCVGLGESKSLESTMYVTLDVGFSWLPCVEQQTPTEYKFPYTVATNAVARHNATSQAALRQRALFKVHSLSPNLTPYIRLGNFDGAAGNDDWERRSQVSSASQGASSNVPFVYIGADLGLYPRSFTGIALKASTDATFEVTVEFSDDGSQFHSVAVHRQTNGWANTTWPAIGPHRWWRIVASFTQVSSNKKSKRNVSTSFSSDTSDEKYLSQFSTTITNCAIANVAWFTSDHIADDFLIGVCRNDIVALRKAQLTARIAVPRLNPLHGFSVPVGLQVPECRSLTCSPNIDLVDGLALFALWRTSRGRPAPAVQRAASTAEDQLQQSLPHATNPHLVLDKESAQKVSRKFFSGKEFEMSDVTMYNMTNRMTNDPVVVLRGSAATGVRGITPGTRIALQFEWYNTSLIPSQAVVATSALMTMERNWLSVQSEVPGFDLFTRAWPSLKDIVFVDLDNYLTVYSHNANGDVCFGGNFPSIPLPQPGLAGKLQSSVECIISDGVSVLSPGLSLSAIADLFSSSDHLRHVAVLIPTLFSSECSVVIHSSFAEASIIRLDIVGESGRKISRDCDVEIKTLKLVVRFDCSVDCGAPQMSAEIVGEATIPPFFGSVPFFLHASLGCASDRPIDVSLLCADDSAATRYLLSDSFHCHVRQLSARTSILLNTNKNTVETLPIRFDGLLWFSNVWKVPFTGEAVPCLSSQLELSAADVVIHREQLMDYVDGVARSTSCDTTFTDSVKDLRYLGTFQGRLSVVVSRSSGTTLRFIGRVLWSNTSRVPCTISLLSPSGLDSPIAHFEIVFPSGMDCVGVLENSILCNGRLVMVISSNKKMLICSSFSCVDFCGEELHLEQLEATSQEFPVRECSISAKMSVGDDTSFAVTGELKMQETVIQGCWGASSDRICRAVQLHLQDLLPRLCVVVESVVPLWVKGTLLFQIVGAGGGVEFGFFITAKRRSLVLSLCDQIMQLAQTKVVSDSDYS